MGVDITSRCELLPQRLERELFNPTEEVVSPKLNLTKVAKKSFSLGLNCFLSQEEAIIAGGSMKMVSALDRMGWRGGVNIPGTVQGLSA